MSRLGPILLASSALAALPAAAASAGGLYVARRIDRAALRIDRREPPFDAEVLEVRGDEVLLAPGVDFRVAHDLHHPGVFGLKWDGGYSRVGDIVQVDQRVVRRKLFGPAPPVDAACRLDSFAFTGDPHSVHGLAFEDVACSADAGALPAWMVRGGQGDHWTIAVHGKGSRRQEFLRMLPALHRAGETTLVVTYRNDAGVAPAANRRYGHGSHEWPDLEAAVRFAIERGASRITLFGCSMGAAIALAFMRHSDLGGRIDRLILDSPMVDLRTTIEVRVPRVPSPLLAAGWKVLARRGLIDAAVVDYLDDCHEIEVPVLLIHGDADERVHVSTSDTFAERVSGPVRYHRPALVGHVRAWNADPDGYEQWLSAFLRAV